MTTGWISAMGPDALPGLRDFELVARGPHTTVYRARQTLSGGINRPVAVKVLHDAHNEQGSRELRLTVDLGAHPNIITVYDAGVAPDGSPYIVMEYCPLGSLASARERRSVDEVVAVGIAVGNALAFAHARGVIHRDIKPDNVLVRQPQPQPSSYALADFGIARFAGATMTDSVHKGTYLYASPQHIQAQPPAFTDDMWSLGATLFTLLDGAPPFTNLDPNDNQGAYLLRVIAAEPRSLGRQDVPDTLRGVIARCLHKDPSQRYINPEELLEDLAFAHDGVSPIEPTSTPAITVRSFAEPTTDNAAPIRKARPPRRRRWAIGLSLAAAAMIVTSAVVLAAQLGGDPSATDSGARSQAAQASSPQPSEPAVVTTAATPSPSPKTSVTRRPESVPTTQGAPTEAIPRPTYYGPIGSTMSGRCIGVVGGRVDDGAPVVQGQHTWEEGCNDPAMKWGWAGGYEDGTFKVVNQKSGKCLDISGDAAGSDVVQNTCRDSGGRQLWHWWRQGTDNGWNFGLICNVRTSWCVFLRGQSDAEGGSVNQEPLEPYRKGHQFRVPEPHNPA